jgi:hypothetical protein
MACSIHENSVSEICPESSESMAYAASKTSMNEYGCGWRQWD